MKPILETHLPICYSFQILHRVSWRAQLWVSQEGYGVCHRDYPRAVRVVDDAVDMLANHFQADHGIRRITHQPTSATALTKLWCDLVPSLAASSWPQPTGNFAHLAGMMLLLVLLLVGSPLGRRWFYLQCISLSLF
jgi:hypothetical protein